MTTTPLQVLDGHWSGVADRRLDEVITANTVLEKQVAMLTAKNKEQDDSLRVLSRVIIDQGEDIRMLTSDLSIALQDRSSVTRLLGKAMSQSMSAQEYEAAEAAVRAMEATKQ